MALSPPVLNNVRLSYLALVASLLTLLIIRPSLASFDYHDALEKSLLFFEAQRSGKLPPDQRVVWRGDSALDDGKSEGVDLEGGYYDAGDHVKYGFPMAYSITMLSWGVLQWSHALTLNGQFGYALEAIKWGTDYFIKAHTQPNVLWAEVGDGKTDHDCWQRAEDMTTSRQAYRLDVAYPGSDQAGETAAAMAAASIAFQKTDPAYSQTLLKHARELFTFADTYRGEYDNSITNTKAYYQSVSGFNDELLWAAIWLYEATGEQTYLDYVINNANTLGGTGWAMKEMSWDVKYAGVQILASKILLEGKGYQNTAVLKQYQAGAEFYLCSLLRKNTGSNNAQFTPGGLLFTRPWNNMQYVTSASLILGVYSDYLFAAGQQLQCPSGSVPPSELLSLAQSQVNYILGDNPMGMSYMVGYGARYPQHVHHRGASIISYKKSPGFVSCKGGYEVWYASNAANPNVLVGALVGGPDAGDQYADDRSRYEQSEPTTSTNGPLVGILARFAGGQSYGPAKDTHRPSPHLAPYTTKSSPSPSPTRSYPTLPSPRPLPHPKTPSRGPPPHTYTPGKAPPTPPPVTFRQVVTLSWTHEKKIYRRYEVRVTNISRGRLLNIKFLIKDLTGPLWGLSKVPRTTNLYMVQSLTPHKTVEFIYIQPGPPATISLSSFGSPTY